MTCQSAVWPRSPRPLVRSRAARVRLAVGEGGRGGCPAPKLGTLHGCCRLETLHHLEHESQGSAWGPSNRRQTVCVRAYRRISVRMHVWDVRQVDGSLSERMAEAATPPIRWFTINGLICCWFWKHVLSLLIPVKLSWFCSCSLSFATVKFLLFLYSVLMLNCLRWLRVKRSSQAHLFCHCFYVFTKKKETSICVVYQHLMPGVS